jgi:Ca2+-transporting ATPase
LSSLQVSESEGSGLDLDLDAGPDVGLDTAQVLAARRQYGPNEVVPEASRHWFDIVRDSARDPMLWFLLAAAALFGLLGQATEAVVLLAALLPLAGMDVFLRNRTVASTASLASRLASRARVLRDGAWADLPSAELVPGDLVEIGAGSYFPADGLLLAGDGLQCDESSLTGEALPVAKHPLAAGERRAGRIAERHWGTAGTRLLTGIARMRVVRTGARTRYGELARAAMGGSHEGTPLQAAIGGLVARILAAALALCLLLGAVRLAQGHGWVDATLSAMTLAVAALPEEFPVVYAFFLGLGAFRLARRKALVRRAVAVENIGRITCILSDKTGTLTAGVLTLTHRWPARDLDDVALLRRAARAAREESGDPMDQALLSAAGPTDAGVRLAVFPFTETRRKETSVWQDPGTGAATACSKGAPETILALCDLPAPELALWRQRVRELAAGGRKVIACAERAVAADATSTEPAGGFTFAGLLAFADPLRPGVAEAVRECAAMGIRVVMVTGDHPATAQAIAAGIGLGGTEAEVVALDPAEDAAEVLRRRPGLRVLARATPAQKLQLVRALRQQGELVAVTGDGVNDVPALREADVGVAMGERGTRAAREAAAIVLMDDNFRTIHDAVTEGRRLFAQLQVAFAYLLLVHMPLVLGAALVPLLGQPLLFLPIHIVWLELVIHPTALLGFQELRAGEAPPRPGPHFFSRAAWVTILAVGTFTSAAVILGYLLALGPGQDAAHGRSMALAILLSSGSTVTLALAGARNLPGFLLAALSGTILVVFIQSPIISRWLHLTPLHLSDWATALLAAAIAGLGARHLARLLAQGAATMPSARGRLP